MSTSQYLYFLLEYICSQICGYIWFHSTISQDAVKAFFLLNPSHFGTVALRNNIMRALLYLHVSLCNILPHNSHAEKLYAADERDDARRRCPACNWISEHQLAHHDKDHRDKRKQRHPHAEPGCYGKRCLRKIDNAVNRIF